MWFPRSGNCIRLVGRNQLWHSCTSGPFTGQINQASPSLGHCPESTVWKESHLTLVEGLKGASIITIQPSPCHLPFSLSLSLVPPHALVILVLFSAPTIIISFLPPPGCILHFSLPSHALLLFTHSPTKQIAISKLWSEETCHIVPPYWPCAPQISCDSFLLHCLPAWRRKQSYCNQIQICSIWNDHSSVHSFFRLICFAVYNVCCYSSKDWFENEDQMGKVTVNAEMFMTWNKQELALKYHQSEPLPLSSISGWNVTQFLFFLSELSLLLLLENRWKEFLILFLSF